jgi:hypothetical protein
MKNKVNSAPDTNKIVKAFANSVHSYILLGIEMLLNIENGKMAERKIQNKAVPYVSAVILISCVIDYLSKYRYGQVDKMDMHGQTLGDSKCYRKFVGEYFIKDITKSEKTYTPELVYKDIRCALTHGYSLGKNVVLSHTDKYEKYHLEQHYIDEIEQDRIVIDVFHLYYDLQYVCIKYIEEIMTESKHLKEFMFRWKTHPFIVGYSEKSI